MADVNEHEWQLSPRADGVWRATIRCPGCRRSVPIIHHEIDANGVVTPSVVCANCGHHIGHVVLIGWAAKTLQADAEAATRTVEVCNNCGRKTDWPYHHLGGWGVGRGGLLCPTCILPPKEPTHG